MKQKSITLNQPELERAAKTHSEYEDPISLSSRRLQNLNVLLKCG